MELATARRWIGNISKVVVAGLGLDRIVMGLQGNLWPSLRQLYPQITLTACLITAVLFYVPDYVKFSRVRRFFRLGDETRVYLVLSSFSIAEQGQQHPIFYKKDVRGQRLYRTTVNTIMAGYDELQISLRHMGDLSAYLFKQASVMSDIDFMDKSRSAPITRNSEKKLVISFGSGSSNYLSRHIMSRRVFVESENAYRLSGPASGTYFQRVGTTGESDRLIDDEITDYAILIRWTIKDTTYFVIAGLGKSGTDVLTRYFFENWVETSKTTRYKDFYAVYKLNIPAQEAELLSSPGIRRGTSEELDFAGRIKRVAGP